MLCSCCAARSAKSISTTRSSSAGSSDAAATAPAAGPTPASDGRFSAYRGVFRAAGGLTVPAGSEQAPTGNQVGMTDLPSDVDPAIGEHVITIRNRFGVDGLREAQRLIALEIAIFEDAYDELGDDLARPDPGNTKAPDGVRGYACRPARSASRHWFARSDKGWDRGPWIGPADALRRPVEKRSAPRRNSVRTRRLIDLSAKEGLGRQTGNSRSSPADRSREIPVMQMRSLPHRLLLATGAALLVIAPLSAGLAAATPSPAGTTWTGGKPLPAAPGLGLHRNEDGEPGMGVTPSGQFWVASDIAPYA